jgi:hypothetical protein
MEDMIPGVVIGAGLAYEQTAFDEWIHDVLHGEPGLPIRHDLGATREFLPEGIADQESL